ncbi:MAG: RelA/SpoT domain-containing protein [bacterium]|nr:RelA/SpoT domain-containing protein [bacterium]
MDIEELRKQYREIQSSAEHFMLELKRQIEELFNANSISLGVAIECRLKSLTSIEEKLDRKSLKIEQLVDLPDFIGIRAILLYKRDVDKLSEIVLSNFSELSHEDTAARLEPSQFGYQSVHFNLKLKDDWLKLPTFHGCENFQFELQVRTLAQHIWAAAEHDLQYKSEIDIPKPIRRTIYRVSALLETVDLEFERVLAERSEYRKEKTVVDLDEVLNVDLLEKTLRDKLPLDHLQGDEAYSDLLTDLFAMGVTTAKQLNSLIDKNLEKAKKADHEMVVRILKRKQSWPSGYLERANRGVFYNYVGLVRDVMRIEFGDRFEKYFSDKQAERLMSKRKHVELPMKKVST